MSQIRTYYISFTYYSWKFVIIYLSVTITGTWLEYFFKVLLLKHLLYTFEVLGTIVSTSRTEIYYDQNLFTKYLKFFSLLPYEQFHTSNKHAIIIYAKLQLPSCFLSAAGGCVVKTERICSSATNRQTHARKGTKAEIL